MAGDFGVAERWSAFGRVLLFLLGGTFLLIVAAPICARLPGPESQVVLGVLTSVATLALTALFVRWDGFRLTNVGAAPDRWSAWRLIWGFLVGLLLVALQTLLVMLGGHVQWTRVPGAGGAPTAVALLAYLALACREELAFRGYPLRRLERFFGAGAAQLFVAFFFAVEHRVGGYTWFNAFFGAFVGSLLFGMAALALRGLAVPIGIHAAWNLGQWMLGEKGVPGLWRPVIEEGYKAQVDRIGIISYLVVFASATFAFWLLRNFRTRREHMQARETTNP